MLYVRSISAHAQRVESIVASLPLFRGLPRTRYAVLSGAARLIPVRRGEAVVRRGEPLPGVFAVAEGMINVALHGADSGRVLRFAGPGETFGEAAVLLNSASVVDALAVADSTLVLLPAGEVRALLRRHAGFAAAMALLLARRMLSLLGEIESSELQPAGQRLAAYLLSLARPVSSGAGAWNAHLPASKTLIASRLGIKKETLSRLLHELSGRRLISVSRRDIAILDRDGLSEIGHPA